MRTTDKGQPRDRLKTLALALAWLLASGAWLQADDFDTLRTEWRDFITGGTNLNLSDPVISSRVSGAGSGANNYWNSLNKASNRTYLWSDAASTNVSADLTTCYNRLSTMAQGWATVGSSVYSNASLGADIVAALDWMYTNRYNETKSEYNNWWDWEIGVPMALNNSMVLLYPLLSGTQITNYCNAIDHFTPTVTMTGANRVWKAEAVGVRGVLGRNAAKVAAARDGLSDVSNKGASSVFAYVTSGDGFYRDGSFIQHNKHPYTAGYGITLIRDLVKMLTWLDGTQWTVTDPQRTNVLRWCYDSYEPLIYCGTMPEYVRGREVSRSSSTGFSGGHAAINGMLRLAQTAPAADAARLKSLVKYWDQVDTTASLPNYVDIDQVPVAEQLMADSGVVPRGELLGHYQFPSMDRLMHLRPGFGFGLSMFSTRIYNYECINSENWHAWFTAYGMTYLWSTNDLTQFSDSFWPTVDPYHLPGTTVDLTALVNGARQSSTNTQPWVGGAVLSNSFGVAGMALDDVNGPLVANKSWFAFDNEIVCLGAGISCTSATNVQTTVENRNLHTALGGTFTVNGTAMPTTLGWSSNLTGVSWCALDNVGGYYFPGGANLLAQRTARVGRWADINGGGSTNSITRNFFSLVLDHGLKPSNAGYAYVLLPNASAASLSQYAAQPQVTVLTNTAALQAVRETSLGLLAANFWSEGAKTVDLLTASTRAAVICRETNGVLEIAVSDPTWTNTGSILLTYKRAAASLLSADPGVSVLQLTPTVQLSISVSGAHGKTFQTRLAVPAQITAVPDRASTGGATPITIAALANDLPLDLPLTLASVASPAHGVATVTNQLISYIPAAGFTGTDTFNYFITDGPRQATGSVSVAVGAPALTLTPAQVLASSNQPGNVPANTVDNDLSTRWSAEGDGQWVQYDLLSPQLVSAASVAFFAGDQRLAYLDINLSRDGTNWTPVFSGQSSGTTTNLQRFDFPDRWARFVRIVGHGNSQSDWNSLTEVRIHAATNAAPIAVADSAGCLAGSYRVLDLLGNDSDPDNGPQPLCLTALSAPAHGRVTSVPAGVRYVPAPGYAGQDSFSYLISDSALTSTGTVTIAVTNLPNVSPQLVAIPAQSVMAGATLCLTNQAADLSTPPQRLRFSLLEASTGARIDPLTGGINWRPAIALAGTSNRFTVVVTQNGWLTNLAPLADAYVRDGSFAQTNYGVDSILAVKLSSPGLNRESYLKFNLAGIPGVLSDALLQLTPVMVSLPGTHAVAEVADNSWGELSLTWSNKPASGPVLATWIPQAGMSTSASVAAAAQDAWLNNAGLLSLRVFATNTTSDGLVYYGSEEGSSNAVPQLAVSYSTGAFLSATQSFWVAVLAPPPPVLGAAGFADGQLQLALGGVAGPDYIIQTTTNLQGGQWTTLLVTNPPVLPCAWTDTNSASFPNRFYRVLLGP